LFTAEAYSHAQASQQARPDSRAAALQDEHDLSSLQCKRGQYCPDPSQQLPCPAGSFCTSSSVQPVTCDINTIIATDTFAVYSQEDYFVTRVYQGKEALKGNYCPVNSTKPSQLCP
jgi:hypothetical protein